MSIVSCCELCAAILRRELDMTHDQTITGVTDELLQEMGVANLECLRDEMLIVGLKQSFANLATPAGEGGPMDHPTKGVVLLCGPGCIDELEEGPEVVHVEPGMIVFFPKFSAVEIQVSNRRLFVVKLGDVKARQRVTAEQLQTLSRNTY